MKKAARIAKWIAGGGTVLALVAVLCSAIWWAVQPRHAGKTIYWWFDQARIQIGQGRIQIGAPKGTAEVEFAFRSMGSNAVPFLIKRLQTPDVWPESGVKQDLKSKLFGRSWVPNQIKKLLFPPAGASSQFVAFELLKSMGSAAISAQPLLEEMLSRTDLRYESFHLLRGFGVEASNSAPVMARYFSHTNRNIQSYALSTFAAITPPKSPDATLLFEAVRQGQIRAARGVPILVHLQLDITELLPKLGDELCMTGHFHTEALAACRRLRLQGKVLVPRFAEAMQDPDPGYRCELLKELRKDLIPDATPALSVVVAAVHDPYWMVRLEAAKTLVDLKPGAEKLRAVLALVETRKQDQYEYVMETLQAGLKRLETSNQ